MGSNKVVGSYHNCTLIKLDSPSKTNAGANFLYATDPFVVMPGIAGKSQFTFSSSYGPTIGGGGYCNGWGNCQAPPKIFENYTCPAPYVQYGCSGLYYMNGSKYQMQELEIFTGAK